MTKKTAKIEQSVKLASPRFLSSVGLVAIMLMVVAKVVKNPDIISVFSKFLCVRGMNLGL